MPSREDMSELQRLVSIDVGYSSLGLVVARVQGINVTVDLAEKVDLRSVPCCLGCTLPHSGNVVDRMAHFTAYYHQHLHDADLILIERQPITGITDVQALLYDKYRDKTELVSPVSLHKHFGLPKCAYNLRKEMVVDMATPFLAHLDSFTCLQRQHDVSDALVMILFVVEQQHLKAQKMSREQDKARRIETDRSAGCFDRFRCAG